MALKQQLISQFAKMANAKDANTQPNNTVYGVATISNGQTYVKIDGSTVITPAITTSTIKDGDRVTVKIENHTAVITGNITSPAARTDDVEELAQSTADYSSIKKSVEELLIDMSECKNDIDNLQKTDITTQEKIGEHTETISINSETLADHETRISSNTETLTDHETRISSNTETLTDIGNDISSIKERLDSMAESITDIISRLETLETPSTEE